MATRIKETDLFNPIKDYFINKGCEVYSEVLFYLGNRADIVVKQDNIITVVEMKTSLSLDLLEQANRWLRYAHYVYIAVPETKKGDVNQYARKCLMRDGIGMLQIDLGQHRRRYYDEENPHVSEYIRPHLNRRIVDKWGRYLTEAHKDTLPGGTKGGGYITPYKTTIDSVKRCLKRHPEGVSLNDLVQMVQTHYSNPKQGLYQALTSFEWKWCDSYIVGRQKYFRIKEGVKI